MFDSAIGTDFMSSDDEKSSLHGHTTKRQSKGPVEEDSKTYESRKNMQKWEFFKIIKIKLSLKTILVG